MNKSNYYLFGLLLNLFFISFCPSTLTAEALKTEANVASISGVISGPLCNPDGTYCVAVTFDFMNPVSSQYNINVNGVEFGPFNYPNMGSGVAGQNSLCDPSFIGVSAANSYSVIVTDAPTGTGSAGSPGVGPQAELVVTEILPDPIVNQCEDEYIVITYNACPGQPDPLDISGLQLIDNIGVRHTFPAGSTIANGASITHFSEFNDLNGDGDPSDGACPVWNNGGDAATFGNLPLGVTGVGLVYTSNPGDGVLVTQPISTLNCGTPAICFDTDSNPEPECTVLAPMIVITKDDADNGDDTQTVTAGGVATFTITVANTGNEALCNLVITDTPANGLSGANCELSSAGINAAVMGVGNMDSNFDPSESFTYTCTIAVGASDFQNIIAVQAEGCTSGNIANSNDNSQVIVVPVVKPNPPSVSGAATYCEGDMITDLVATGDPAATFTYYSDAALTAVIQTGATYTPTGAVGTETIYVTQTVAGCESAASAVSVTVLANPDAPMLMDITVCEGESTEIDPNNGMGTGGGSSILYQESFDTDGEGVDGPCTGVAPSTCAANVPPATGQWSITGDVSGMNGSGDFVLTTAGVLKFQDTGGEVCFTSSVIDISGCAISFFSVDLSSAGGLEASDYVDVNPIIDGVSNPIPNWMGMGDASHTLIDDFTPSTVSQTGIVGSTMVVEICVLNSAASEMTFLDNLVVGCEAAGGGSTNFKYYDMDPALGGVIPVAGPTTDPFDPMTAAGMMDMIWVTACEGPCEGEATKVTVTVNAIPTAPIAMGAVICDGDVIADIVPAGDVGAIFSYYSDAALLTLIQTGATYTPVGTVGTETIYITQTVNGCESEGVEVTVEVLPTPLAPTAESATFCIGEEVLPIIAVGDAAASFTYYSDAALTAIIQTDATYVPAGLPGVETVYVTQSVNGCESLATEVTITIAGFENITTEPTCNAGVLDYCLDITFDFAGPGTSNMYEVVVNGFVYGPFTYGATGSEALTICDPVNFIGDEQIGLDVEIADVDRGNITEGITQTGGGVSNLEGCIEIASIMPAQNADNNGDGVIDFCDEFITLTNGGTGIIDISGYTISDAITVRHIFPTVTIINPGQTITLFNSDMNQLANCASSGIWNNGGDDVILNDGTGALVDMETYNSSTVGVAVEFDVIGCGMGTTTSTGPSACLQINSVMANQTADNNGDGVIDFCDEFITLTNPGNMPLDISGYRLLDGGTFLHIFLPGTILAPGQILPVFNSDFNLNSSCPGNGVWNNTGDLIRVFDASFIIADEEPYGSLDAGEEFFFEIDACPVTDPIDSGICSGIESFDEPNCCPVIEVSTFMGMSICAGSCPAPGQGLMASADCGNISSSSETKWYADSAGMFLVFEGDIFDPISEGVLDNSVAGKFKFYAQVSCDFCLSELVPITVDIFDCDPPLDACGGCTYMVQLYDTAFNGWDGARFMISLNDGSFVEYKPTAADCGFLSFPIDILDGGEIDYMYMPGANAEEHAYKILDPLGNIVATEGMAFTGTNIIQATVTSLEVNCPACCTDAAEPFTFVFTAGTDAFEKSWELRRNDGTRVAFANGGAYAGIASGQSISTTLFLDPCEEYTMTTFSGRNNGWEGASYSFVSTNAERGTPIDNGNFLVASGPDDFSDELQATFTLPCSIACPDEETILADDLDNCILSTYTADIIDAPVCYPNNCHISTAPTLEVCYPTAVGGLVEGPLGVTAAALPVGSNPVVYKVTYSDGQMIRCTSQVHVISEINPVLACNDFVILPLIYSTDDCETVITADMILEASDPCNAQYLIELTDPNGNDLGNVISLVNAGQTIDYSITQIGTGLSALCEGQILVEDKAAPILACFDYEVNCNHPNALDETYSHTEVFGADEDELPGNIAGGTESNPSELFVTIPDVGCGPFGEIIQDINVTVDLMHNDIEDLTLTLVAPDGTSIILLERRTCNNQLTQNINVTFDTEATAAVFSACSPGFPGLNGTLRPAEPLSILYNRAYSDLQGDWTLIVRDDDDTAVEGVGVGELLNASIELTAGFPFPYAAVDCNLQSVSLVSEIIVDTNCDQTGGRGANIVRVWKAEDAAGNVSQCTQTVGLIAPNVSDLTFPADVELACGSVPADPALLSLEDAGTNFFECFEVNDSDMNNCDLIITFDDEVFDSCGDGYKLFRTWTIVNWCSGTTFDHLQTILVTDKIGPQISQSNITIGTNEDDCTATVELVDLEVIDACSAITDVTATYLIDGNLNIVDLGNGEVITGLPLGTTTVSISATDECANVMVEDVNITVIDDVSPVALCLANTNVSLTNSGFAELLATDFGIGSEDNCSEVTMLVRSLGCEGGPFAEMAEFSCCDLGTVVVELQVTDAAGNTNICWAEVLVEDAIAPTITCQDDVTITCDDELIVEDLFASPDVNDNCDTSIEESEVIEVELPNCGKLLTKTYTVSDGSDKSEDASCTQSVTVVHVSDFIVQFPSDEEFTDCGLEDIPGVIITENDCEQVAVSVEDRVFIQVEDACYKIERTYTIINHCIVDDPSAGGFTDQGTPLPIPNTFRDDDGYFQWTQIIKVTDEEAPSILFTSPDPCDFTEACEGRVVLTASAEDACSGIAAVELSYAIDEFGDGTFEISGSGDDATGIFPYGDHIIRWIATDGCGNATVEDFAFSVQDCKNPTPVCQGVTTVIMNNGECVSISASDLLEYAEDNCTVRTEEEWNDNARVRREGSIGALMTALDLCCEDIVDGVVNVEVWIDDEAGNSEFCIVSVVIQDNGDNCPTVASQAAGIISTTMTEIGEAIEGVNVAIDGVKMGETNESGAYQVGLDENESYQVEPTKNDGHAELISTFDLVLMAQHVLQINELDSPYKLIAADVNRDGIINIFDLIELRQLILYQVTEFANTDSWIFIPTEYEFENPASPFSEDVPFVIDVDLLDQFVSANFIGVKMGNLDGSNGFRAATIDERGAPKTLVFEIEDRELIAGERTWIHFVAKDFNEILGFQYTLDFDPEKISFESEKAAALNVSASNFGKAMLNLGALTSSYHDESASSCNDGQTLFSIEVMAHENVMLGEVLSLSSQYTGAEAYANNGDKLDLRLEFISVNSLEQDGFALYQNKPNPFKGETIVEFALPKANRATLSVYDLSGRLLHEVSGQFEAGINQFKLNKEQLSQAGLLYYTLSSGEYSAQKKMIILE